MSCTRDVSFPKRSADAGLPWFLGNPSSAAPLRTAPQRGRTQVTALSQADWGGKNGWTRLTSQQLSFLHLLGLVRVAGSSDRPQFQGKETTRQGEFRRRLTPKGGLMWAQWRNERQQQGGLS